MKPEDYQPNVIQHREETQSGKAIKQNKHKTRQIQDI